LLLVHGAHLGCIAQRVDRLVGRQRHAGGVLRIDACVVAKRGERRGDDPFGKALVGDGCHVIGAEAALPFGNEHIFAAQLQAPHPVARTFMCVDELLETPGFAAQLIVKGFAPHPVLEFAPIAFDMHPPIVGIGIAVEVGTEHGLRFFPFGHTNGGEAAFQPGPRVEPHKVDIVRAKQKQLRHDRVVVILGGKVAIRTGLGLGLAHSVREMRGKGLARKADRGDRRLLHIDPFAVDVGRGQHQRT